MKKLELVKCTSLGKKLADSSVSSSFSLQVSEHAFNSATPPSNDPDNESDWIPVTLYVNSVNPITETTFTDGIFKEILQNSNDKEIRLLVDENIKSYRILVHCTECSSSVFVAASGNFEN